MFMWVANNIFFFYYEFWFATVWGNYVQMSCSLLIFSIRKNISHWQPSSPSNFPFMRTMKDETQSPKNYLASMPSSLIWRNRLQISTSAGRSILWNIVGKKSIPTGGDSEKIVFSSQKMHSIKLYSYAIRSGQLSKWSHM